MSPRFPFLLRLLLAQENVLLGGQAVLEGVMMRSPNAFAVAVRRPDGGISYLAERAVAWTRKHRLFALPVVRGAVTLVQTLGLGIRALNFSTEQAFPEEAKGKGSASGPGIWLSLALALALGIGLFFVVPLAATEGIRRLWPPLGGGIAFNLVDGLIRGAIFLAYVWAIGRIPDIGRLFRYHGAEHKVVHAWEAGRGMEIATVQEYPVLHPRCGTSFLLFVMVVSILVFCFIPAAWPAWGKALARVALVPLIAGLSYELIRFSARHREHPLARLLVQPGLWLQRLTTGQPDDSMVEVSLAAFRRAAELEGDERFVL